MLKKYATAALLVVLACISIHQIYTFFSQANLFVTTKTMIGWGFVVLGIGIYFRYKWLLNWYATITAALLMVNLIQITISDIYLSSPLWLSIHLQPIGTALSLLLILIYHKETKQILLNILEIVFNFIQSLGENKRNSTKVQMLEKYKKMLVNENSDVLRQNIKNFNSFQPEYIAAATEILADRGEHF